MHGRRSRSTLPAWLIAILLSVLFGGGVYVAGYVPLLPHPWPNGWEAAEDAPRVTIYEYIHYKLFPVQPLVGAS